MNFSRATCAPVCYCALHRQGGHFYGAIVSYRIRNRDITPGDLDTIRGLVAEHWTEGRTVFSHLLCERWNWLQPNGALKDRACRVLLLTLAQKGVIELHPSQSPIIRTGNKIRRRKFVYDTTPLDGRASRAGQLHFSMVRRTAEEGLWDHLIETYHYLGNPRIVGSHLKYLASLDGHPVAALGGGGRCLARRCPRQLY